MDAKNATEANIRVKVAQKGLEAWVRIVPAIPVAPDDIRSALAQNGVVEGIDDEVLVTLSEFPPEEEVLVARGQPPVNGENARIDYLFQAENVHFSPLIDQNDRADFREGNVIQNVVEGQLIARKVPATPGFPGRAVNGETIPPVSGRDVHIKAGKNVELSYDKLEATSTITGIPKLNRGKLEIQPVFMVGEVDFSVGNINFQGAVSIRGNVNPGFVVKATEDIMVSGNVEQATLEAGGSIRVNGGVRSGAKLHALQDIAVRFCDSDAFIEAGHEVKVLGDALHSTLKSGHVINIGNHLIGGTARATELVQVVIAGSPAETPTRIELVQESAQARIDQLREDIAQLDAELSKVSTLIQMLMGKPQDDNTKNLQKLVPTKVTMNLKLLQYQTELKELIESQDTHEAPRFVVKGELFPGVVIQFATPEGQRTQRIMDKQYGKTLRFVNGEIES
jgi:hypothetical protein